MWWLTRPKVLDYQRDQRWNCPYGIGKVENLVSFLHGGTLLIRSLKIQVGTFSSCRLLCSLMAGTMKVILLLHLWHLLHWRLHGPNASVPCSCHNCVTQQVRMTSSITHGLSGLYGSSFLSGRNTLLLYDGEIVYRTVSNRGPIQAVVGVCLAG